ncbi:MAG TPA: Nif11-like leader peptide family RiPP precursor [Synergistales bacterium]|nr:Nif11-like leader peptide family RiPP precursor [Synergistales bacterium]
MSIESAVAFYERVEKDTALQAKLKELNTKENISQYVKGELGYDFTLEEMQKVIFERNPEMTDEELEAVVGGDQLLEIISQIFMSLLGAAA